MENKKPELRAFWRKDYPTKLLQSKVIRLGPRLSVQPAAPSTFFHPQQFLGGEI